MIKDSGNRTEFSTGAVRDVQKGKGRCDLIPLDVAGDLLGVDLVLDSIHLFQRSGATEFLYEALKRFALSNGWSLEDMLLEVSVHYEEGCEKYGERNWEKGLPVSCFMNSAVRHYLKWRRGDSDERHDRAFVWNIMGAIWTVNHCTGGREK